APVSPVKTVRPGPKDRSSRSISTTSRMESAVSMRPRLPPASKDGVPGAGQEPAFGGTLRSRRWHEAAVEQVGVAVLVPAAARIVVAEHRRRLPRLVTQAQDQVDLGQPVQRLGDVVGGLVVVHNTLEPPDRRLVQVLALVPATDLHLLAGQMVAAEID